MLRSVIRRCASIRSAAKSRRCEVVRGVVERRAGAVRGAVLQTTTAERLVVDGRAICFYLRLSLSGVPGFLGWWVGWGGPLFGI